MGVSRKQRGTAQARRAERLDHDSVRRARTVLDKPEEGMATAEYALVPVAATGFAGVLVAILKSDAVRVVLL